MSIFHYTAKNKSGEKVSGRIEAQNRDEAVELISQQGLLPITAEEKTYASSSSSGVRKLRSRRVSPEDLYIFSRQLASLIKAGMPLLRALSLVKDQAENAILKDIINSIHKKMNDGQSFSEGLSSYPNIFSLLYITMVQVGEEGGNLQEMLFRLSEHQKSQRELVSKVRSALTYPIFMAAVGFATVFFILTFVMPNITALFTSAGTQLPIPTRLLMNVSHFLQISWVGVLIVIGAIAASLKKWSETEKGRAVIGNIALRLPLFGKIVLKTELTRFCSTLSLLLHSGISLQRALQIAVPIVGNERIKNDLSRCKKDLELGINLSDSLKKSNIVPAMMSNLINVGEESGSLEQSLNDISDSYGQESGDAIKAITTLLEPMMILIVGLIVGFIVISMLLPIFQIDILAQ